MAGPINRKPAKQTKSDALHEEIRKSVRGKDGKQALDDFVGAVDALIAAFGKKEALTLYVRCGMRITLAKDEARPS